jgi:hypothetical protein
MQSDITHPQPLATFESYIRAMFQFRKESSRGYRRGIEILEEALADTHLCVAE